MSITAVEKTAEAPAAAPAAPVARTGNTWVWQVTALSLVLGGMLALAVRTTEKSRTSMAPGGSRLGLLAALIDREKEQTDRLQQEVAELRRQKDLALARMKGNKGETDALKRQFDAVREMAGLSAVTGPGLDVTIQDSPVAPPDNVPFEEYLVHDQDLNQIISSLKAAGAQHLAISGADSTRLQRVVVTTTARCVGPTAVVNGTYLSAPYHIFAIGNAAALRAALERPDGYVRGQRELDAKKMIEIKDAERLVFPEYTGKLQARYAKPVPEKQPGGGA
jgi:uncharacterized protein YlxW (UPF0749 family)